MKANDVSKKIRLKNKSGSGIQTCEFSKLRNIKKALCSAFLFFEYSKCKFWVDDV